MNKNAVLVIVQNMNFYIINKTTYIILKMDLSSAT